MKDKKISVLIVTYKQADVIGRNIESILQQKEYGLHEIVICDDCSPDNNWDVIQSYVKMYPNVIRAYRNNPNLGIYGNSDKCASLHGDADLFCWLEGDDALCNGFFKAIQEAIIEQKIDVSQAVGIQANFKSIDPQGNVRVYKNDYVSRHLCSPVSAKIRQLTSWRGSVFSKKVIEQFKPTVLNKGLALAEELFDVQWFRYADKFYYINVDGSIYYTGIGVSVELNGTEFKKWAIESIYKWEFLIMNLLTNVRDTNHARSQIQLSKLRMNRSLRTYFQYVALYVRGNIGYPIKYRNILALLKTIRNF